MNAIPAIEDIWFATFADRRLKSALKRLRVQAAEFGIRADRSSFFDETGLDGGFIRRMGRRFTPKLRGYGFWCWKPQVILQMLEKMPEGDVLLYLDGGCHLNAGGRKRFGEYLEMLDETDIVTFQAKTLDGSEYGMVEEDWTKGDCLDFFGVRHDARVAKTGQLAGGLLILRNTSGVRNLVCRWRDVFFDHFDLVDDTPSRSPNAPGFRKNRHDQSVFSILCKLAGYDRRTISSCEMFPSLRKLTEEQIAAKGGRAKWGFASFSEMTGCPLLAAHDVRLTPFQHLLKNVKQIFGIETLY